MKTELIDGYEVTVTESKEFLSDVEEAALLLLDPSYFGHIPEEQRLSSSEVVALANDPSCLSMWDRPGGINRPFGDVAKLALCLTEVQIQCLVNKLASNMRPLCLMRLRCGEFYNGSILNHFSHLLQDASGRSKPYIRKQLK